MTAIEDFLSAKEEEEIIQAIRMAERNTSGEIRIHIESHSKTEIYKRTADVFHFLKMDNTKLRNGVLIYVAVNDRSFVIYGDQGINDVVGNDFWENTRNIIQSHFKTGNYKKGLIDGVIKAGEQLERYFPWSQNDTDELPNEISKG